jgi:hypothetical protein
VVVAVVIAVAITVMVMIVPVALVVPAMAVFIPPPVVPAPAMLASLMQLVAGAVGLPAVPAMMPNSLVEFVIGPRNAMLAIIAIGERTRSSSKEQEPTQCGRGQYSFPKSFDISREKSLHEFIPPGSAQGSEWAE